MKFSPIMKSCKKPELSLLLEGSSVEILSPTHVRQVMVNILKDSLGVYEG